MNTFTVKGFLSNSGKFSDINLAVSADSPVDATEKALKEYSNLVVSSVSRTFSGRHIDY